MIFQRDFDLPVTGIVDQLTWDTIKENYYQNLNQYGIPPMLHVFPSGSGTVGESEQASELYIVQAMIHELQKVITNFESSDMDGINSGATMRNLRSIQRISSLPDNGSLDRATWAVLAALYRILITRRALPVIPLL